MIFFIIIICIHNDNYLEIFKFIICIHNARLTSLSCRSAIHGQNAEIIHKLEDFNPIEDTESGIDICANFRHLLKV